MKGQMELAKLIVWGMVFSITATVWGQSLDKKSATTTKPAAIATNAPLPSKATPVRSFPQTGRVKGNNVYVRSGSNQNYYPVTKLNRGNKVTVVGEEFGWFKIMPPKGTHSLIEKTYVDRVGTAENIGTINGRTWIYAGSNLNDHRYAKQVKLNKGRQVKIVGTTDDGEYYKIVPPEGAHLWMSSDWVERTEGIEQAFGPKTSSIKRETKTPVSGKSPSPTSPTAQTDKNQSLIDTIEKKIATEAAKPTRDRIFEPIIKELQPLANQSEDELAQLYAKTRLKQLQAHMEIISALREMRELRTNAISAADEKTRERALIKHKETKPMDDIAVRGEIRTSGIYDGSGNRPKRWRVVNPTNETTIAYIDLPAGSPINPIEYYGKYIGIRASARRVDGGTIPPMPIYTVEKILVLDREQAKQPAPGKLLIASPPSPTPAAAAPSSQPAGETSKTKNTGNTNKNK